MNSKVKLTVYLPTKVNKLLLFVILTFVSHISFACRYDPGNMDRWIEDSIEIVHIKVISTHIEPNENFNNIRINYEVIERFTGQEKDTGFVLDGTHNCALWMRAGSEYLLFIDESRAITRSSGSTLISPWHEKSQKLLNEVRAKTTL